MKSVLAISVLMFASVSFASMCSPTLQSAAALAYSTVQKNHAVGNATGMDVLEAEKLTIDASLCGDLPQDKFMNVSAIAALGKNISARVRIVEISSHAPNMAAELARVQAELNTFNENCSQHYVHDATLMAADGMMSPEDLQIVKDACAPAVTAPAAAASAASAVAQ